VGDKNQLASIEAGNAFARIVEKTEQNGRLAHLKDLHRQRDPILRAAADSARNGKMKESIDILEKSGKVKETSADEKRLKEIAGQYNKDTLIITSTRKSKMELDARIRNDLKAAGQLSEPQLLTRQYQTEEGRTETDELEVSRGEQITFTMNEYRNYDIRNGERATITAINGDTMAVKTEGGRDIEIDTKAYAFIDYGYSMTTYKSQGQTYDKVIVNADTEVAALEDMRNQYVQITRARDDIRLYTDDKERLQELSQIRTMKSDTLDLNISIEECKDRERSFAENVLREKGIKVPEVEQPKPTKEKLLWGKPERMRPEPPQPAREFIIQNEKAIERYAYSEEHRKELRQLMVDTSKLLNDPSGTLSNGDKNKIAELLNSDVKMFCKSKTSPAQLIESAQSKLSKNSEKRLDGYSL
jgi:hypothetical protein